MRTARSERPREATFDLTPMIDVLLLLIIFFMMTSQFTRTQLRPVDLPRESGEKAPTPSPQTVFLDLDAQGRLFAVGRPVTLEQLPSVVGTGAGGAEVVIRADRQCAAAHLNRLGEALAGLGIRDWKLATAPQGRRPAP